MAERGDAELTAAVLAALRDDVFMRPLTLGMQISADNGIVTLRGSVDSELNRQTAEHVAREAAGVRDVVNLLTVMDAESSGRSDADLLEEIKREMRRDLTIEAPERFYLRVRFGRATASGTAESEEERDSVLAAIRRVPGVEGVDDLMDVKVPVIGQPTSEG